MRSAPIGADFEIKSVTDEAENTPSVAKHTTTPSRSHGRPSRRLPGRGAAGAMSSDTDAAMSSADQVLRLRQLARALPALPLTTLAGASGSPPAAVPELAPDVRDELAEVETLVGEAAADATAAARTATLSPGSGASAGGAAGESGAASSDAPPGEPMTASLAMHAMRKPLPTRLEAETLYGAERYVHQRAGSATRQASRRPAVGPRRGRR
eukprot:CAMPEP_0179985140 /NCGR_PEP_ID=MMETSP0984-20121128/1524_1 /TAXON_ID=483367 /ORGANISM="non described non described, Strain CCMP 2436" /LENGTH=210 /DNA_ID=CAMNT_0021903807 /DNA_START=216 /DNA_END=844 /DNA_ORIENTATION=-